jgi:hypothetical protein
MKQPPKTPAGWAAYRAKLSAGIAHAAINGDKTTPPGISTYEWAQYNLAHAIESIADCLMILSENTFLPPSGSTETAARAQRQVTKDRTKKHNSARVGNPER